jgi:hypothetical protein
MKTYQAVIERAGRRIYDAYMGGAYDYHNVVPCSEIAFIYEKTVDEVNADCEQAFEMIRDIEYERTRYAS